MQEAAAGVEVSSAAPDAYLVGDSCLASVGDVEAGGLGGGRGKENFVTADLMVANHCFQVMIRITSVNCVLLSARHTLPHLTPPNIKRPLF